jgi:hypothetical protein
VPAIVEGEPDERAFAVVADQRARHAFDDRPLRSEPVQDRVRVGVVGPASGGEHGARDVEEVA